MTLQEKKSKMASIVSDWQASGLTQVEYVRIHDFKLSKLRYWISKHRQSPDEAAFIEISAPVARGIHIRYPHGVELTLPVQTPAGLLKVLINL
jgi:hypothetical protein